MNAKHCSLIYSKVSSAVISCIMVFLRRIDMMLFGLDATHGMLILNLLIGLEHLDLTTLLLMNHMIYLYLMS